MRILHLLREVSIIIAAIAIENVNKLIRLSRS